MPYKSKIGCEDDETTLPISHCRKWALKGKSHKSERYYFKHIERLKEYNKTYYQNNREYCKAKSRKYHLAHKESRLKTARESKKKWYSTLTEEKKKAYREAQRVRYHLRKNNKPDKDGTIPKISVKMKDFLDVS